MNDEEIAQERAVIFYRMKTDGCDTDDMAAVLVSLLSHIQRQQSMEQQQQITTTE